ncbi:MAG: GNAT family N-acetyltransferase [Lachnospiraceae bacterium]|nr:GNAT family N-acetyltransferase [Lachnospiraceae bacterium]
MPETKKPAGPNGRQPQNRKDPRNQAGSAPRKQANSNPRKQTGRPSGKPDSRGGQGGSAPQKNPRPQSRGGQGGLKLKQAHLLTEKQRADAAHLIADCRTAEGLSLDPPLDLAPAFEDAPPAYYLLSGQGMLLSLLVLDMPVPEEGEITAFTHPACRRRGYFTALWEAVCARLADTDCEEAEITFVTDGKSRDALAALAAMDAELSHTEFFLEKGLAAAPGRTAPALPENLPFFRIDGGAHAAVSRPNSPKTFSAAADAPASAKHAPASAPVSPSAAFDVSAPANTCAADENGAASLCGPSAAIPADPAGLLSALHEDIFADGASGSRRIVTEALADPQTHTFFLTDESGAPAALCHLKLLSSGQAYLYGLGVRPDLQEKGLGRAFLARIESEAVSLGAAGIFLQVGDYNEAACALYRGADYKEKERRAYYV